MSWVAPVAMAGGNILGSMVGGKAQQNAANSAAQEQQNLMNTEIGQIQSADNQQRGAINSLLPYTTGGSQLASALQKSAPYFAPGQGAAFGGQTANPNGSVTNYSSLLSPHAGTPSVSPGMTPGASAARALQ
jgi:hypothetical protein